MKKIRIFSIFAFSLCLLFSCNNFQDVIVKEKNPTIITTNVEGNIEDFSTNFIVNNSDSIGERTILPAAWTLADADNTLGTAAIGFWLYGKATNGEVYGPERIYPDASGNFNFDVGKYNWVFTLFACDQDDRTTLAKAEEAAVLKAHATVDLRTSTMSAIFRLTSEEIKRAGYADIDVLLDDWNMGSDFTAKISLRNIVTDETIFFENGESTARGNAGKIPNGMLSASQKYNFGWGMGIVAGTYNFCVDFTNTTTGTVYSWSEIIVIVPGKTTQKNNLKVPRVIESIPAAPENFAVSFDKSTADIVAGYYNAYFTWTDNANNEDCYELVLTDTSGETVYDTNIFASGEVYNSGSLSANSTAVSLRLELGKKYSAKLRAKNGAGYSSYSNSLNNINLYRVRYFVQGGKWYSDWNSATQTGSVLEVGNRIEYYKMSDGSISIWKYADNGLSFDGNALNGWYRDIISNSNKITPGISYSEADNIDLYAIYEGAEVTEEKLATLVFDSGWVRVNDVVPGIGAGGTPEASINGVSTLNFKVNVPVSVGTELGIDGFKFDSLEVRVINTVTNSKRTQVIEGVDVAAAGSDNLFTFSNLATGEYNVITTASYSGYTKSYTVNLTVIN